jgi:hypothetical protein
MDPAQAREAGLMDASPSTAGVTRLLAAIRWQARAWVVVESLAVLALATVAGCWAAYAVDRLVEPPAWVRAVLLAAVVAVAAWIVVVRLVARFAVPLSDESLALAVERAHPDIGDALSTLVSCAGGATAADGLIDRDLLARTEAEARGIVARVRPRSLFRLRRLAGLTALAAVAVAVTAGVAAARPGLAGVWMRRLLCLSNETWPRRVRLEAESFVDGRLVVACGADVDVVVRATALGPLPEVVELRTRGRGGWRTDRMGTRGGVGDDGLTSGQTFGHVLPAVVEDLDVEVRGGDARLHGLRLAVVDPPAIDTLSITSTPPPYLAVGPQRLPASRLVPVPRGSRVDLVVRTTKPLTAAVALARAVGSDAEPVPLAELDPADPDRRTITVGIASVDADTEVLVKLTDDDGITNRDPMAVVLAAVPDAPPRLTLRLAGIGPAVTPGAVLPIEGTITDDHGVADAAVRLDWGDGVRDVPIERATQGGAEVALPADRPERVPLGDLGLAAGMRLAVTVAARDGCGLAAGANLAAGDTWTLDVVSPEALRAALEAREVMLRRRFEAAVNDLSRARDAAVEAAEADVGRRLGEAIARAAGETDEVAAGFRSIRRELETNGLLSPELDGRLTGEILDPLAAVLAGDLAVAAKACRSSADRRSIVSPVEASLARMRAILDRMLELESVNEVVERLRGVIDAQERIHEDTLEMKRKRGREALESP